MDQALLIEILPCYLVGDLPEEMMAMVRERLAEDDELREIASELTVSSTACDELFRKPAPGLLYWQPQPAPSRRRAPTLLAGVAVMAVAAGLMFMFLTRSPVQGVDSEVAQSAQLRVDEMAQNLPRQQAGWFETSSPEALSAHFAALGLPEPMQLVADGAPLGLELVGGALARDGGTVALYRDAAGHEYSCFMGRDVPLPLNAPRILPSPKPQLPALEVAQAGALAAVGWRDKGMFCVLVSQAPEALVLELARRKVWG